VSPQVAPGRVKSHGAEESARTRWRPKTANGKTWTPRRPSLARALSWVPTHVSATSIDGHGSVWNQVALVRVHGGAILDPGDVVDDG
jgi:hypothetical protein